MTAPEQFIRDIEAAFAAVTRANGLTLHEAAAFEGTDYASPEERARVRALDTDTRWQDIPDSALDECVDGFAADEEGFRYHLPAYMRWYSRHHRGLAPFRGGLIFHQLWLTGHKAKDRTRCERSFDQFTLPQKRLIARFLELMALEGSQAYIRDLAEQAWRSYWYKFSDPPAASNGDPTALKRPDVEF